MSPAFQKPPTEHWTIDRKIPIAAVIGIAIQTGIFVWWGSKLDSRVETLERSDVRTDAVITARIKVNEDRYERFIRIEEQIKALLEIARRQEARMERPANQH